MKHPQGLGAQPSAKERGATRAGPGARCGLGASRAERAQKTVCFKLQLFLAPVICAEMIKLCNAK